MAALCRAANLSRKLSSFRISYAVIRSVATNSNLAEKETDNTDSGPETNDVAHPKRDHLAVLKALARTVQPTALAPPRELFEDLFLYPKSTRKREECKAARESGYKAAEFVLKKYPQLFPMRKPEPAWEVTNENDSVQTEQDLKVVISKMKPQDAITAYEKLISDGVAVSLDTKNDLLDLVGYYGTIAAIDLDNVAASGESDSSSSSDSDDSLSPEDSESSDDEEDAVRQHKNTWSMNNYAEKLFSSMEEKNSRTYDAMILALIKHNYSNRAFELFKEMREKNFQASIYTYNILLNKSPYWYGRGKKLWGGVQEIIGHMKQDPAVLPNLGTYNALLKLCVLLPDGTEKAMEVFRDMTNKGIEPTLGTYSLLIRAEYYKQLYAQPDKDGKTEQQPRPNNSLLQTVISHLETCDRLPTLQHPSDVRFFNTAMGSAVFCQDANAAHRLYALAETNDSMLLGGKRGQFYAAFLVALARSEKSAEVVYHMYKELVPSKLIPHNWVYSELFKMVEREKMPRLVPRLYQDMKRYRVPLNEQTCKGIFAGLARRTSSKNYKQYVEIMEDVFYWMKKFDIPISPHMISQLVKQYCAGGHLQQAWKVMKMFEELNFHPTYTALIQLLNCCSMNRDRDEAVKVFELMAKYGNIIPKRRRSNFFDNTQMPLSKRMYINSLFDNQGELDKRRKMLKSSTLRQDNEIPTEQAANS